MKLQEKNKSILVTKEEYGTLNLIELKLLGKFNKLMNYSEAKEAIKNLKIENDPIPFPFIFAPNQENNQKAIKNAKKGEIINLINDNEIVGHIVVDEIYLTKDFKDVVTIFESNNLEYLQKKKMGEYAIAGEIKIYDESLKKSIDDLNKFKKQNNIKTMTTILMSANPFHRAHERLLRLTIDKADLVVIFLLRGDERGGFTYESKERILNFFINSFLPKNKVFIIPFKDTYLYTEHTNPELECILAYNLGATKIVLGQKHTLMGLFIQENQIHSIVDKYKNLPIEILIMPEYVFCVKCKSIVSTKNCPHGQHQHIRYSKYTLKELLKSGIMPPPILMRREISAMILEDLFPNRFENFQFLYDRLFPNNGILKEHTQKDFYEELMKLYQICALT